MLIAADPRRIALLTDFGHGLYVGQLKAWLNDHLPELPLVDLIHDLPPFRPDLAAYLLPALVRDMPPRTLYLVVVDPGVGGERGLIAVAAGENWFVAPDNGLLSRLVDRAGATRVARVGWQPSRMSASFHARDWFVPVVARWCRTGDCGFTAPQPGSLQGGDWPDDRLVVVYVDQFGNLLTGMRASQAPGGGALVVAGRSLGRARTFCDVPVGEPFWYENALGLVEIAVNRGRADVLLGCAVGDEVGPFV